MHTATTEGVSLCMPDEKLTAFLELEAAIRAAKCRTQFVTKSG
jgi:hypothetical protein